MNIYYITVRFTGSPYVPPDNSSDTGSTDDNNTFEPIKITYNVTDITWKSKG